QFNGDWASNGTLKASATLPRMSAPADIGAKAIPGAADDAGKCRLPSAPAGGCPQFNGDRANRGTLNTLAATCPVHALCTAWVLLVAACTWSEPAANSKT